VPLLSNLCCMTSPFNPLWLHHSNYTLLRVKVMKLLIMQFSPPSYHLSLHGPNVVPKTPSVYVRPLMSDTNFIPVQNHRQNYSFMYTDFYIFRQQTRSHKFLNWMAASITQIQPAQNCICFLFLLVFSVFTSRPTFLLAWIKVSMLDSYVLKKKAYSF
jgi:hypothetical protein